MRYLISVSAILILLVSFCAPIAIADELPSLENAAKKIQQATVTVRIASITAAKDDQAAEKGAKPASPRVSVFSGISLGQGLVVTPLYSETNARVRITVVGGQQAEAKPLVFDEYSGLTLLQMDVKTVPGLDLAQELPSEGVWVTSAAAWGVEKPVISLGIVSGVERTLPGTTYPPLVQCDLRTAETSSGAGIVDRQGKLIGIIVAAELPQNNRGWTYAVPVKHIKRLLRANTAKGKDEALVVLQRRRPIVGMVLDGEPDRVVVRRVTKGSPAEKAGIQQGDVILGADGIKIRSVYQAVRPTLYKQPGDTITFMVQQKNGIRSIEVVLGGGVVLPGAPSINLAELFQPKIIVDGSAKDVAGSSTGDRNKEFTASNGAAEPAVPSVRQLLEKALDRYRNVIVLQQEQINRNKLERATTEAQIEALQAELQALKKKLDQAD